MNRTGHRSVQVVRLYIREGSFSRELGGEVGAVVAASLLDSHGEEGHLESCD